jgi:hypothetical protein
MPILDVNAVFIADETKAVDLYQVLGITALLDNVLSIRTSKQTTRLSRSNPALQAGKVALLQQLLGMYAICYIVSVI